MPCWVFLVNITSGNEHESYPECTRDTGNEDTAEARLPTLGSDSLVDTLPEPDAGVDVPGIQDDLEIRGQFDLPCFDVHRTLPAGLARGSKSGKPESGQDARSLECN